MTESARPADPTGGNAEGRHPPYPPQQHGQQQYGQQQHGQQQYGQQPAGYPPQAYGGYPPAMYGNYQQAPIGKVRGTGVTILLAVVTLGIYSLIYFYSVHDEMKRHTGQGIGGGIGLVLALFVGIASPFVLSSEVGELHARTGRAKPVSGVTGLWYFPGIFILVGPLIWFVKTNGALNDYWRTVGAR